MLVQQKGQIHFSGEHCTRCGTCDAVCPTEALSLVETAESFDVHINHDTCILCNKCVAVCPAEEMDAHPIHEEELSSYPYICTAAAANQNIRLNATSGGVAKTLVHAVLEQHLVNAVYCVTTSSTPPYYHGAYLTDANEIGLIANSVYYALPVNAGLKKKINGKPIGRLLFIGTNCQIQGARRFYASTKTEVIYVTIICKQQKTKHYLEWAKKRLNLNVDAADQIIFRGPGWPGTLQAGSRTYAGGYWRPFHLLLWRNTGCRYCTNPLGYGSDFLLADPWGIITISPDEPGQTLVMVKTQTGMELWKKVSGYLQEIHHHIPMQKITECIELKDYINTKINRVPYYRGHEKSFGKRLKYRLLDYQRACIEFLLLRLPLPDIVDKILVKILPK